ncbi:protein kinase superfamily protein, partial [Striga asiatica]
TSFTAAIAAARALAYLHYSTCCAPTCYSSFNNGDTFLETPLNTPPFISLFPKLTRFFVTGGGSDNIGLPGDNAHADGEVEADQDLLRTLNLLVLRGKYASKLLPKSLVFRTSLWIFKCFENFRRVSVDRPLAAILVAYISMTLLEFLEVHCEIEREVNKFFEYLSMKLQGTPEVPYKAIGWSTLTLPKFPKHPKSQRKARKTRHLCGNFDAYLPRSTSKLEVWRRSWSASTSPSAWALSPGRLMLSPPPPVTKNPVSLGKRERKGKASSGVLRKVSPLKEEYHQYTLAHNRCCSGDTPMLGPKNLETVDPFHFVSHSSKMLRYNASQGQATKVMNNIKAIIIDMDWKVK